MEGKGETTEQPDTLCQGVKIWEEMLRNERELKACWREMEIEKEATKDAKNNLWRVAMTTFDLAANTPVVLNLRSVINIVF